MNQIALLAISLNKSDSHGTHASLDTHARTASHGTKVMLQEFRRMMADRWKQHQERHDEKKDKKEEKRERKREHRHSRQGSDLSVDSMDLEVQPSATSSSSAVATVKVNPAPGTSSSKSLASESARAPAPTLSRDQATTAPLSAPATSSVPGTATEKPGLVTESPPKPAK